jgi:tetratricopeptide (TPR) repeat protein
MTASAEVIPGDLLVNKQSLGPPVAGATRVQPAASTNRGRPTIKFVGGPRVTLHPQSSLKVLARNSANDAFAELTRGKMLVAGQGSFSAPFKVKSGSVVHFELNPDGKQTVITVVQGTAEVLDLPPGQPKGLKALQQGLVTLDDQGNPERMVSVDLRPSQVDAVIDWSFDINQVTVPREKRPRPLDTAIAGASAGDVAYVSGSYSRAAELYAGALAAAPDTSPALQVRLGDTYLALRDYEEAAAWYEKVIAAGPSPHADDAMVGRAWIELSRSRFGDARSHLGTASADPQAAAERLLLLGLLSMREGSFSAASAVFEDSALLTSSYGYQAQSWLAFVRMSLGDWEGAVTLAQRATDGQPTSALARANQSIVHFFRRADGDLAVAAGAAAEAIRLNPNLPLAHVASSQAAYERSRVAAVSQITAVKELERAWEDSNLAVQLDPRLPEAHYALGVVMFARRDYRGAADSFETALALAPQHLPTVAALASTYINQDHPGRGEARLLAALKPFADQMKTDPNLVPAQARALLTVLGQVYYYTGRYYAGEDVFRLQASAATTAQYDAAAARFYIDNNELRLAIERAQSAVAKGALEPGEARYHAILGLAYDFSGFDAQAEREYRTALALNPQEALAKIRLGIASPDAAVRVSSIIQGFLLEPGVSRHLLRGGIRSNINLSGNRFLDFTADGLHRLPLMDGRVNTLLSVEHHQPGQGGDSVTSGAASATAILGPRNNLYGSFGVIGAPTQFSNAGDVAARHQTGSGDWLWLRLGYANRGESTSFYLPQQGYVAGEARFDHEFASREKLGPILSTFGFGYAERFSTRPMANGYLQFSGAVMRDFTLSTQFFYTSQHEALSPFGQNPGQFRFNAVGTYRLDGKSSLRALVNSEPTFNNGIATQFNALNGATTFALRPTDTLISTEPFTSRDEDARTIEFDYERYLTPKTFAKAFLFNTSLDAQDESFTGGGGRFEFQLRRYLFLSVMGAAGTSERRMFNVAQLQLNFIDGGSQKRRSFLSGSSKHSLGIGVFGGTVVATTRLAKEFSLEGKSADPHHEVFLSAYQRFDASFQTFVMAGVILRLK